MTNILKGRVLPLLAIAVGLEISLCSISPQVLGAA